MKALVTGGAGFIGSHVVDRLVELGWEIVVVDSLYSGRLSNLEHAEKLAAKKGLSFEIITADVSLPETWEALPACQSCFHFAAQTSVTRSVTDSEVNFSWNVKTYEHLFHWALKHRVKTLVYANTAGALYDAGGELPFNEESFIRPASPYGSTKYFTELMLFSQVLSLKASGVLSANPNEDNYFSWCALRLANVYGPRQITKGEAGVVPIFCDLLSKGERPTVFGSGAETRDYVHVSDVSRAFVLANEKMIKEPIDSAFNIGTSIQIPTGSVYDSVFKLFEERGLAEAGFRNPHHAPLRPGEIEHSHVNIDKAARELKWSPKLSFEKGVRETVEYFLENELTISGLKKTA